MRQGLGAGGHGQQDPRHLWCADKYIEQASLPVSRQQQGFDSALAAIEQANLKGHCRLSRIESAVTHRFL